MWYRLYSLPHCFKFWPKERPIFICSVLRETLVRFFPIYVYYITLHIKNSASSDITVWPGKPWTLKISQECLFCYDQSQQTSGYVNWPQNQKLIY